MGQGTCAVRLVEPVLHRSAQQIVVSAGEGRGDQGGVGAVFDRVAVIYYPRQGDARGIGLHLGCGYEHDETKVGRNVATEVDAIRTRGGEPSERRGRGVVRVSLEAGAHTVELDIVKRSSGQPVEPLEDAQPNGHAAAEAAGAGNIARDAPCEIEMGDARDLEKGGRGSVRHGVGLSRLRSPHRDAAVECQSHAETIETRAEIGAGRRNAEGHLIHISPKSLAETNPRGKHPRTGEFSCRRASTAAK